MSTSLPDARSVDLQSSDDRQIRPQKPRSTPHTRARTLIMVLGVDHDANP